MIFLTLTFRSLSGELTHAHHKQRVHKTFVIKYAPIVGPANSPQVDCQSPENIY